MTDQAPQSADMNELLQAKVPELKGEVDAGNFDAAMNILVELQKARSSNVGEGVDFKELLKDKAKELHERIAAGEYDSAMSTLQEMHIARDQGLYQEVGRLTRALHNAITNFHIDAKDDADPNADANDQVSEMKDATDRLGFVVEMTENAANKTLDLVEASLPVADNLKQEASELKAEWQRLVNREMSPEEFRELYWRLDNYFNKLDVDASQLSSNMTEILMAQDFQDLTGQVINKVTGLVKEVEASLVDLVFMASQVETITGIVTEGEEKPKEVDMDMKGHGPQMDKEQEDVMASQDDVDDLLSSLGF